MSDSASTATKKRKRSSPSRDVVQGSPPPRQSQWDTGDFEIISKDNVFFRTPTHRLLTWSNVFGHMVESGHGPKIIVLEHHSTIIEQFFHIMDNAKPDFKKLSTRADGVHLAIQVAQFLDCYDCVLALRLFLEHLSHKSVPPLIIFMIGVTLRRPELCASALQKKDTAWASYPGWTTPQDMERKPRKLHMLHPSNIPRSLFLLISNDYTWALLHSKVPVVASDAVEEDYGKAFTNLLGK